MPDNTSREKRREYEARYREKLKSDKERLSRRQAAQRDWRNSVPEKRSQYGKTRVEMWRDKKPWHIAYKSAFKRAKHYDGACDITSEWAEEQWRKGSALSGLPFSSEHGPFCASIDRIDSDKGYTKDNCRMILLAENLSKNSWDDEALFQICEAMLKFNGRWPE